MSVNLFVKSINVVPESRNGQGNVCYDCVFRKKTTTSIDLSPSLFSLSLSWAQKLPRLYEYYLGCNRLGFWIIKNVKCSNPIYLSTIWIAIEAIRYNSIAAIKEIEAM